MIEFRRTVAAALLGVGLAVGLAACDTTPDEPPPSFDELESLYWDIEERIFPGARTPEETLTHAGRYFGVARLAYYADGQNYTGGVRAEMDLVGVFFEDAITGNDLTGFVTEDGGRWPGRISIRRSGFVGNSFNTIVRGELEIFGSPAQFRGRLRGSFWGEDGHFAFGTISFAGPDGVARLSGTFALRCCGEP